MFKLDRNGIIAAVVAFVLGLIIGNTLLGWYVFPVEWTDAGPQDLSTNYGGNNYQELYLRNLADLYAFNNNQDVVRNALRIWPEANQQICQMAEATSDPADAARLQAIAAVNSQDGLGCASVDTTAPAQESDEGPSLLLVCLIGLLFLLIVGVIVLIIMRRGGPAEPATYTPYGAADDLGEPESTVDEGGEAVAQAIARFTTEYKLGDDTYDDSFPIENAGGDFLGECGVGISESIGAESPRHVTAFEVWLFDKNDIRTITKVVMSDHAFFDDAIKAKLSPKGEPMLARPNEIVVLETASLIINAEIVEMEYGDDPSVPENSYFERFTIELSAWTKETGGSVSSASVDDTLTY